MYLYAYTYVCIYICCRFKHKRKTEAQEKISLICLAFTHRPNRNMSFVRLLTKKQTEVINVLNGLNGLAHL